MHRIRRSAFRFAAAGAVLVLMGLAGCAKKEEPAPLASVTDSATAADSAAAASAPSPATGEPFMTDIKTGTGPAIKKGQTAVVHYTGWLYAEGAPEKKGEKFDSS